jgi:basic membrane lipoprotein Med (substrate-binding protein (PBP1-ABC) superfamily)
MSSSASDSTRVALLTAGPVSDQGWYAGAFEGLMMLHDSLGMQVSHQQTRTPAEFDEAFLSYAGSGFDLIFAHGFEYQDAAIRAGERFPDVTIVVSGGGRVADNVVPLIFTLEDASYLAGMLAGGTTRTDTIGMVGGVAIPPVQGTFRAFEAGARAVNPGVTVLEAFIGNWDDVAAAKEAAVAQLGRGADVLIHNTDAASFGVFQAVRESVADGRRAWALGMNRDQHAVASDVILGSAVIRIPEAFLEVARRWLAGELGGAPVYEGLTSDVVDLVVNPALEQVIDPTLLDRIDVARTAIRDGTLDVPRVPFVEGEAGVGMESGEPEG